MSGRLDRRVAAALVAGLALGAAIASVVFVLTDSGTGAPRPLAVAPGPARAALAAQLEAIGRQDYVGACALYAPEFFTSLGRDPALCQQALSKDFAGQELAFRIDRVVPYASTKAIAIVEIAQGDAAGACRQAWHEAEEPCPQAAPFAALLVARDGAWRVAALNGV